MVCARGIINCLNKLSIEYLLLVSSNCRENCVELKNGMDGGDTIFLFIGNSYNDNGEGHRKKSA